MYMYSDLNSFDGIEKVYNSIEPLRGQRKTWDIRPLGKRSKWWERIVKVDDNTYALTDGWWASQFGRPGMSEEDREFALFHVKYGVPIIWQRREDGDYIQIRSNINESGSYSRYRFLGQYLPQSLKHEYDQSGLHWISYNGTRHLLPKSIMSHDRVDGKFTTVKHVDKYLEFKHSGVKQFDLSHGGYKKSSPVVNKDLTKHYKQAIRDLWEYAKVVLPVYGYTLLDQRRDKYEVLGTNQWEWQRNPKLIRDVLDDPEANAEKRLALCVIIACAIHAYEMRYITELSGQYSFRKPDGAMFKEEEDSWNKFRRTIHKIGGMMTTKDVDFK